MLNILLDPSKQMEMSSYRSDKCTVVRNCLTCDSENLVVVYDLGACPLTDNYISNKEESLNAEAFPLVVCLCKDCGNLQLRYQVSPQLSYGTYHYNSKITLGLDKEFLSYANQLILSATDPSDITVLDVGSNDGSFLLACKENKINAYGIEPSSTQAASANALGLPTLATYFDENTSSIIEHNKIFPKIYDFITFNNVLANLPDPISSLRYAVQLLRPQTGQIVIQSGYHPLQFRRGLFDWTYHEHFSYFSLKSLTKLASQLDMQVQSFQTMPLRGGSFRAMLGFDDSKQPINYEHFTEVESFIGLRKFINSSREYLHELLLNYHNRGFNIIGFGASHSTGVLVHAFGIKSYLSCLLDDNDSKHGLYMPGTSLLVKSPQSELTKDADLRLVIVVLAWQYYDVIVNRLRNLGFRGPIICPVLL